MYYLFGTLFLHNFKIDYHMPAAFTKTILKLSFSAKTTRKADGVESVYSFFRPERTRINRIWRGCFLVAISVRHNFYLFFEPRIRVKTHNHSASSAITGAKYNNHAQFSSFVGSSAKMTFFIVM